MPGTARCERCWHTFSTVSTLLPPWQEFTEGNFFLLLFCSFSFFAAPSLSPWHQGTASTTLENLCLLHLAPLFVGGPLLYWHRQRPCDETRLETGSYVGSVLLSLGWRFTQALLLRSTNLPRIPNLRHQAHAAPLALVPDVRRLRVRVARTLQGVPCRKCPDHMRAHALRVLAARVAHDHEILSLADSTPDSERACGNVRLPACVQVLLDTVEIVHALIVMAPRLECLEGLCFRPPPLSFCDFVGYALPPRQRLRACKCVSVCVRARVDAYVMVGLRACVCACARARVFG